MDELQPTDLEVRERRLRHCGIVRLRKQPRHGARCSLLDLRLQGCQEPRCWPRRQLRLWTQSASCPTFSVNFGARSALGPRSFGGYLVVGEVKVGVGNTDPALHGGIERKRCLV